MNSLELDQRIEVVRRFNRFYTQKIGVLTDQMHDTPFTLTEARVLFEIGSRGPMSASQLTEELGIDPGYLSRLLASFESQRLILRSSPAGDRRKRISELAPKGRAVYQTLVDRAREDIKSLIDNLSDESQAQVVRAMTTIRETLSATRNGSAGVMIRTHRSGDIGWIVERHGDVYHREYGWDQTFEALVARILAELVDSFDDQKDRIWIAEIDGERVGCILAARADDEIVRLRLFLVEPWARGRGIGKRLIQDFLGFARSAGYRKAVLWTQSNLVSARHLYEKFGFTKVEEEAHHSFGHDLIGEHWALTL